MQIRVIKPQCHVTTTLSIYMQLIHNVVGVTHITHKVAGVPCTHTKTRNQHLLKFENVWHMFAEKLNIQLIYNIMLSLHDSVGIHVTIGE